MKKSMTLIAVIMQLASMSAKAKSDKTKYTFIQLKVLQEALLNFRNDVGRFPSTSEGLAVLIGKPATAETWHGPYINYPLVPLDAWGNQYIYRSPTNNLDKEFDLYSVGPNHNDEYGQNDDVVLRQAPRKIKTLTGDDVYLKPKTLKKL